MIHVARIALRDQLKDPEAWSRLDSLDLSEQDRRDIADVATGVHTEGAAGFLLAHLKSSRNRSRTCFGSSTTSHDTAPPRSMPDLVALAVLEKRRPSQRLELLKAVQQGAQERGMALDESSRRLAKRLAGQLMASTRSSDVTLGIDVVREFEFRDMQEDLTKVIHRRDLWSGPGCTPWVP